MDKDILLNEEILLIKEKYNVIISDDIFYKLLRKCLEEYNKLNKKEIDINIYINDKLKEYLNIIMQDNDKLLFIINNYINNNFQEINKLYNAIKNINGFIKILNYFEIYLEDNIINDLLKENYKFKENISYLYNNLNNKSNLNNNISRLLIIYENYLNSSNLKNINNNYDYQKQRELIRRIQNGDNKAKEELIIKNDKLVLYVVNKHLFKIKNGKIDREDLIQEGRLGLLKAAEKFDLNRPNYFSTYAVSWIRQYINNALKNNNRTIRLSSLTYNLLLELHNKEQTFYLINGVYPTIEELANEMKLPINKVKKLLLDNEDILSLDTYINDDKDLNYYLEDTSQAFTDYIDLKLYIEEFKNNIELSDISKRNKEIIMLRYGLMGERKSLEDIGQMFNLTKEGVRKILTRSLSQIGYDKDLKRIEIKKYNI